MKLTAKHYAQALYELSAEVDSPEKSKYMKKFLSTMYSRGHIKWLPTVVRELGLIEERASGITHVRVTTARESDSNEVKKIVQEAISEDNIELTTAVDPVLLGGMRIETRDKRWDLSVRGQLQALIHTMQR